MMAQTDYKHVRFRTFSEARQYACGKAAETGTTVSVQRTGDAEFPWAAKLPYVSLASGAADLVEDDKVDPFEDTTDPYLQDTEDAIAEIQEELSDNAQNWARSEEEGWYYPDTDN